MKFRGLRGFGTVGLLASAALILPACADSNGDTETGDANETDTEEGAAESDFPSRTMTYVVPYNPGGSTDPVGREFSRLLGEELDGEFVVQNLPGGDETIGMTYVFQSEPDGHTMGLSSATGIVVQPLVNDDLGFSGPSDFTPVVKMVEAPNVLAVAADSPFESLDDFIEEAEERPGELRVATTGRLTNNSFAIALLEKLAEIDVTLVPYSGGAGEAVRGALGGEVDAVIPTAAGQRGLMEAGDLRGLAHTGSTDYDELLFDTPAFSESGYEIPMSSDYVTVAAPDLPDVVRDRLIEAALTVAESDAWAEWCAEQGFLADPMAGDELTEWLDSTTEVSGEAIELMGGAEEE